ncbi:MAG: O-antigen ligase family protein [Gaiellaceae bacterium]
MGATWSARVAVAAVPLVLVPALGAVQGGFHPDAWVWSAALAAWAAALALVLGASADRVRRDWPWLVAAGALLLWTLASAIWSVEPAQSVLESRRMLVYAAVVLALIVLARRGSAPILLAGAHAGIVALVLLALARYFVVPRSFDQFEGYLLSEPLGYANAVGILSVMGILLSIGAATDSGHRVVRATSGAAVPLCAAALTLSESRASWLAFGIGLAATIALHRSPWSVVRMAAALALPAATATVIARYSGLGTLDTPHLGRPVVALAAVVCSALAAVAAVLAARRPVGRAGRRTRGLVVAAVAGAGVLGIGAIVSASLTEPRSLYYHVAWREFLAHPLLGSGAGTFGRYWLLSGPVGQWGGALDAHSLYLETLAELGPVGLCLLIAFLLYPLRATVAHRARPFVPAAAGATIAFYVHAGLDWDWELPALVVAALACAAAVAFSETQEAAAEPSAGLPSAARAATLAAALLAGVAAIAGARSTTEPSASSTLEAPQSGASSSIMLP